MFSFSIRNAFRRKWVLVVAILGTGLGCALMTVLMSLSAGMEQHLDRTMTELAGVLVVYPEDAPLGYSTGGENVTVPSFYVEGIEGMDHVDVVSPAVSAFIMKGVLDLGDPIGVALTGVVYEQDRALDGPVAHITEGQAPENENEVIIGRSLRQYAEGHGEVPHLLGYSFGVPVGNSSENLTIVGVYETGAMFVDFGIYGHINTARAMSGLSPEQVSSIRLRANSVNNVEAVASEIEAKYSDVIVIVPTDLLGQATEAISVFDQALLAISVVAVVAGGASIFIVMFMSVTERRREFGILKASGWSNRNIILSVVIESLSIALMGFAFGIILGLAANVGINHYLGEEMASLTPLLIVEILAFGIGMGIIGGLYPAIRATRVSPIEALRAL